MVYTGAVRPGGPSALRVLGTLALRKLSVGPMDNDAYLLTCRTTGEQLLVDAAAEPERLLALVREGDPAGRLAAVVTTHRHADHHGALGAVLAATGARHLCGADDADAVRVPGSVRLHDGDTVRVGAVELEVVALRGHTPGSVALVHREPAGADTGAADAVPGRAHVLTGDSLFPGGPGRTAGPAEFASLLRDLEDRVFGRFGDDTWIYPGHGDDTTLGAERGAIPSWWARGW